MARRDAALWAMRDHDISQRRACTLVGVDPKTVQRERPPAIPSLQLIERRRAKPMPAADLGRSQPGLLLLDHADDLRLGETAFPYVVCSFRTGRLYVRSRELPGGRSESSKQLRGFSMWCHLVPIYHVRNAIKCKAALSGDWRRPEFRPDN